MASTVLPNGIIVPEKFSRDWYADLYHNWQELDNLLGGGTPKDGTLTIQKNGTAVGTFSANQATDETINITVPTKTSDLNNDSGFITGVSWNDVSDKPSFATVATSGSYDDLSNKPTIPTVNDATLTIQQNGTTVDTFTANSSSDKTVNIQCVDLTSNQTVGGDKEFTGTTTAHDVIPSATDTYNFGSPSYQWNNAYIKSLTINGVAAGDILTHNASEFVGVSGNQTIGGSKTFTSPIGIVKGSGDVELSIKNTSLSLKANTNSGMDDIRFTDKDNLIVGGLRQSFTNSKVIGMVYSRSYSSDGNSYTQAEFALATDNQNGISDTYVKCNNFYPSTNATTNLGTSTNKWKSFNGVEPSDLSLPSDTSITIDTTNFAWGRNFTFTPSVNGYLFINIGNTNGIKSLSLKTGRGEYYFSNQTNILRFTMPVYKGKLVTILANSSAAETVIPSLSLFPCLGNV